MICILVSKYPRRGQITASINPVDMAVSPDGQYLWVVDSSMNVYTADTSISTVQTNIGSMGQATSVAHNPINNMTYAGQSNTNHNIYVLPTLEVTSPNTAGVMYFPIDNAFINNQGLGVSPDGSLLVAATDNSQILFMNGITNNFLGTLISPTTNPDAKVSPDGAKIYSTHYSADTNFTIINTSNFSARTSSTTAMTDVVYITYAPTFP